jgi:hypothetical protein
MRTLHGVCPWLISILLARIMQQAGTCLALRLCCYSTDYLPTYQPTNLPTYLPTYLPTTMYPRPSANYATSPDTRPEPDRRRSSLAAIRTPQSGNRC